MNLSWIPFVYRQIKSCNKFKQLEPTFIDCVRQKILYVHRYNMKVLEVTFAYPLSNEFVELLTQYVLIESRALYRRQEHIVIREASVQDRILRILMHIFNAFFESKMVPPKEIFEKSAKAIINIFIDIKRDYSVNNKLMENMTIKLLKRTGLFEKIEALRGKSLPCPLDTFLTDNAYSDIYKTTITSDYGTDDGFQIDDDVKILDDDINDITASETNEIKEEDDSTTTFNKLSSSPLTKSVLTICLDDSDFDSDEETCCLTEEVKTSTKSLEYQRHQRQENEVSFHKRNHRPMDEVKIEEVIKLDSSEECNFSPTNSKPVNTDASHSKANLISNKTIIIERDGTEAHYLTSIKDRNMSTIVDTEIVEISDEESDGEENKTGYFQVKANDTEPIPIEKADSNINSKINRLDHHMNFSVINDVLVPSSGILESFNESSESSMPIMVEDDSDEALEVNYMQQPSKQKTKEVHVTKAVAVDRDSVEQPTTKEDSDSYHTETPAIIETNEEMLGESNLQEKRSFSRRDHDSISNEAGDFNQSNTLLVLDSNKLHSKANDNIPIPIISGVKHEARDSAEESPVRYQGSFKISGGTESSSSTSANTFKSENFTEINVIDDGIETYEPDNNSSECADDTIPIEGVEIKKQLLTNSEVGSQLDDKISSVDDEDCTIETKTPPEYQESDSSSIKASEKTHSLQTEHEAVTIDTSNGSVDSKDNLPSREFLVDGANTKEDKVNLVSSPNALPSYENRVDIKSQDQFDAEQTIVVEVITKILEDLSSLLEEEVSSVDGGDNDIEVTMDNRTERLPESVMHPESLFEFGAGGKNNFEDASSFCERDSSFCESDSSSKKTFDTSTHKFNRDTLPSSDLFIDRATSDEGKDLLSSPNEILSMEESPGSMFSEIGTSTKPSGEEGKDEYICNKESESSSNVSKETLDINNLIHQDRHEAVNIDISSTSKDNIDNLSSSESFVERAASNEGKDLLSSNDLLSGENQGDILSEGKFNADQTAVNEKVITKGLGKICLQPSSKGEDDAIEVAMNNQTESLPGSVTHQESPGSMTEIGPSRKSSDKESKDESICNNESSSNVSNETLHIDNLIHPDRHEEVNIDTSSAGEDSSDNLSICEPFVERTAFNGGKDLLSSNDLLSDENQGDILSEGKFNADQTAVNEKVITKGLGKISLQPSSKREDDAIEVAMDNQTESLPGSVTHQKSPGSMIEIGPSRKSSGEESKDESICNNESSSNVSNETLHIDNLIHPDRHEVNIDTSSTGEDSSDNLSICEPFVERTASNGGKDLLSSTNDLLSDENQGDILSEGKFNTEQTAVNEKVITKGLGKICLQPSSKGEDDAIEVTMNNQTESLLGNVIHQESPGTMVFEIGPSRKPSSEEGKDEYICNNESSSNVFKEAFDIDNLIHQDRHEAANIDTSSASKDSRDNLSSSEPFVEGAASDDLLSDENRGDILLEGEVNAEQTADNEKVITKGLGKISIQLEERIFPAKGEDDAIEVTMNNQTESLPGSVNHQESPGRMFFEIRTSRKTGSEESKDEYICNNDSSSSVSKETLNIGNVIHQDRHEAANIDTSSASKDNNLSSSELFVERAASNGRQDLLSSPNDLLSDENQADILSEDKFNAEQIVVDENVITEGLKEMSSHLLSPTEIAENIQKNCSAGSLTEASVIQEDVDIPSSSDGSSRGEEKVSAEEKNYVKPFEESLPHQNFSENNLGGTEIPFGRIKHESSTDLTQQLKINEISLEKIGASSILNTELPKFDEIPLLQIHTDNAPNPQLSKVDEICQQQVNTDSENNVIGETELDVQVPIEKSSSQPTAELFPKPKDKEKSEDVILHDEIIDDMLCVKLPSNSILPLHHTVATGEVVRFEDAVENKLQEEEPQCRELNKQKSYIQGNIKSNADTTLPNEKSGHSGEQVGEEKSAESTTLVEEYSVNEQIFEFPKDSGFEIQVDVRSDDTQSELGVKHTIPNEVSIVGYNASEPTTELPTSACLNSERDSIDVNLNLEEAEDCISQQKTKTSTDRELPLDPEHSGKENDCHMQLLELKTETEHFTNAEDKSSDSVDEKICEEETIQESKIGQSFHNSAGDFIKTNVHEEELVEFQSEYANEVEIGMEDNQSESEVFKNENFELGQPSQGNIETNIKKENGDSNQDILLRVGYAKAMKEEHSGEPDRKMKEKAKTEENLDSLGEVSQIPNEHMFEFHNESEFAIEVEVDTETMQSDAGNNTVELCNISDQEKMVQADSFIEDQLIKSATEKPLSNSPDRNGRTTQENLDSSVNIESQEFLSQHDSGIASNSESSDCQDNQSLQADLESKIDLNLLDSHIDIFVQNDVTDAPQEAFNPLGVLADVAAEAPREKVIEEQKQSLRRGRSLKAEIESVHKMFEKIMSNRKKQPKPKVAKCKDEKEQAPKPRTPQTTKRAAKTTVNDNVRVTRSTYLKHSNESVESSFKPHDFLSVENSIPPANTIYADRVVDVNFTSEDSNDSESNKLMIDEEASAKSKKVKSKPSLDNDEVGRLIDEVDGMDVKLNPLQLGGFEVDRDIVGVLKGSDQQIENISEAIVKSVDMGIYDEDTLDEDFYFCYKPSLESKISITQDKEYLVLTEHQQNPRQDEEVSLSKSVSASLENSKTHENIKPFRTKAERKDYHPGLNPYISIERLDVCTSEKNVSNEKQARSKSLDTDTVKNMGRKSKKVSSSKVSMKNPPSIEVKSEENIVENVQLISGMEKINTTELAEEIVPFAKLAENSEKQQNVIEPSDFDETPLAERIEKEAQESLAEMDLPEEIAIKSKKPSKRKRKTGKTTRKRGTPKVSNISSEPDMQNAYKAAEEQINDEINSSANKNILQETQPIAVSHSPSLMDKKSIDDEQNRIEDSESSNRNYYTLPKLRRKSISKDNLCRSAGSVTVSFCTSDMKDEDKKYMPPPKLRGKSSANSERFKETNTKWKWKCKNTVSQTTEKLMKKLNEEVQTNSADVELKLMSDDNIAEQVETPYFGGSIEIALSQESLVDFHSVDQPLYRLPESHSVVSSESQDSEFSDLATPLLKQETRDGEKIEENFVESIREENSESSDIVHDLSLKHLRNSDINPGNEKPATLTEVKVIPIEQKNVATVQVFTEQEMLQEKLCSSTDIGNELSVSTLSSGKLSELDDEKVEYESKLVSAQIPFNKNEIGSDGTGEAKDCVATNLSQTSDIINQTLISETPYIPNEPNKSPYPPNEEGECVSTSIMKPNSKKRKFNDISSEDSKKRKSRSIGSNSKVPVNSENCTNANSIEVVSELEGKETQGNEKQKMKTVNSLRTRKMQTNQKRKVLLIPLKSLESQSNPTDVIESEELQSKFTDGADGGIVDEVANEEIIDEVNETEATSEVNVCLDLSFNTSKRCSSQLIEIVDTSEDIKDGISQTELNSCLDFSSKPSKGVQNEVDSETSTTEVSIISSKIDEVLLVSTEEHVTTSETNASTSSKKSRPTSEPKSLPSRRTEINTVETVKRELQDVHITKSSKSKRNSRSGSKSHTVCSEKDIVGNSTPISSSGSTRLSKIESKISDTHGKKVEDVIQVCESKILQKKSKRSHSGSCTDDAFERKGEHFKRSHKASSKLRLRSYSHAEVEVVAENSKKSEKENPSLEIRLSLRSKSRSNTREGISDVDDGKIVDDHNDKSPKKSRLPPLIEEVCKQSETFFEEVQNQLISDSDKTITIAETDIYSSQAVPIEGPENACGLDGDSKLLLLNNISDGSDTMEVPQKDGHPIDKNQTGSSDNTNKIEETYYLEGDKFCSTVTKMRNNRKLSLESEEPANTNNTSQEACLEAKGTPSSESLDKVLQNSRPEEKENCSIDKSPHSTHANAKEMSYDLDSSPDSIPDGTEKFYGHDSLDIIEESFSENNEMPDFHSLDSSQHNSNDYSLIVASESISVSNEIELGHNVLEEKQSVDELVDVKEISNTNMDISVIDDSYVEMTALAGHNPLVSFSKYDLITHFLNQERQMASIDLDNRTIQFSPGGTLEKEIRTNNSEVIETAAESVQVFNDELIAKNAPMQSSPYLIKKEMPVISRDFFGSGQELRATDLVKVKLNEETSLNTDLLKTIEKKRILTPEPTLFVDTPAKKSSMSQLSIIIDNSSLVAKSPLSGSPRKRERKTIESVVSHLKEKEKENCSSFDPTKLAEVESVNSNWVDSTEERCDGNFADFNSSPWLKSDEIPDIHSEVVVCSNQPTLISSLPQEVYTNQDLVDASCTMNYQNYPIAPEGLQKATANTEPVASCNKDLNPFRFNPDDKMFVLDDSRQSMNIDRSSKTSDPAEDSCLGMAMKTTDLSPTANDANVEETFQNLENLRHFGEATFSKIQTVTRSFGCTATVNGNGGNDKPDFAHLMPLETTVDHNSSFEIKHPGALTSVYNSCHSRNEGLSKLERYINYVADTSDVSTSCSAVLRSEGVSAATSKGFSEVNSSNSDVPLHDISPSKISIGSTHTLDLISPQNYQHNQNSLGQISGTSSFMAGVSGSSNEISDTIPVSKQSDFPPHKITEIKFSCEGNNGDHSYFFHSADPVMSIAGEDIFPDGMSDASSELPSNDNPLRDFGLLDDFSEFLNTKQVSDEKDSEEKDSESNQNDDYKLRIDNETIVQDVVEIARQSKEINQLLNGDIFTENSNKTETDYSAEPSRNSQPWEHIEADQSTQKVTDISSGHCLTTFSIPHADVLDNDQSTPRVIVLPNNHCVTQTFYMSHTDLYNSFNVSPPGSRFCNPTPPVTSEASTPLKRTVRNSLPDSEKNSPKLGVSKKDTKEDCPVDLETPKKVKRTVPIKIEKVQKKVQPDMLLTRSYSRTRPAMWIKSSNKPSSNNPKVSQSTASSVEKQNPNSKEVVSTDNLLELSFTKSARILPVKSIVIKGIASTKAMTNTGSSRIANAPSVVANEQATKTIPPFNTTETAIILPTQKTIRTMDGSWKAPISSILPMLHLSKSDETQNLQTSSRPNIDNQTKTGNPLKSSSLRNSTERVSSVPNISVSSGSLSRVAQHKVTPVKYESLPLSVHYKDLGEGNRNLSSAGPKEQNAVVPNIADNVKSRKRVATNLYQSGLHSEEIVKSSSYSRRKRRKTPMEPNSTENVETKPASDSPGSVSRAAENDNSRRCQSRNSSRSSLEPMSEAEDPPRNHSKTDEKKPQDLHPKPTGNCREREARDFRRISSSGRIRGESDAGKTKAQNMEDAWDRPARQKNKNPSFPHKKYATMREKYDAPEPAYRNEESDFNNEKYHREWIPREEPKRGSGDPRSQERDPRTGYKREEPKRGSGASYDPRSHEGDPRSHEGDPRSQERDPRTGYKRDHGYQGHSSRDTYAPEQKRSSGGYYQSAGPSGHSNFRQPNRSSFSRPYGSQPYSRIPHQNSRSPRFPPRSNDEAAWSTPLVGQGLLPPLDESAYFPQNNPSDK